MSKKKRKRAVPSGRSGGMGTTTKVPGGNGGAAVRPAPASPGGPNRLERKEAARRARERLRRQMARRRTYRRAGIVLIVAVLVAGIVLLANKGTKGSALTPEESKLLADAPAATQTAGCGSIQTIKPYPNDNDRTHIGTASAVPTPPALSSYPSTPPVSGPHDPVPLPAGVYSDPPDIYRTIHSLEHAAVIIWYAPGTTSDELAKLQTFFGKASEQAKVIVAPYDYPSQGTAGKLPAGKQMVLVAWHHMQTCSQVSLPAAYDFVAHYRNPAPKGLTYKGDAPETNVPI
jgi:hypothetical protein